MNIKIQHILVVDDDFPFVETMEKVLILRGFHTDIAVDGSPEKRREMMERSGRYTVPQIWIGEQHVGGYDDLALLERQGSLDKLLSSAP